MRRAEGGSNVMRASWMDDTLPRGGRPGQRLAGTITVRNDGWDTWRAGSCRAGANVEVGWDATPQATGRAEFESGTNAHDVPPGGTATFSIAVDAPSRAGGYLLSYDVDCGRGFFESANNIAYQDWLNVR